MTSAVLKVMAYLSISFVRARCTRTRNSKHRKRHRVLVTRRKLRYARKLHNALLTINIYRWEFFERAESLCAPVYYIFQRVVLRGFLISLNFVRDALSNLDLKIERQCSRILFFSYFFQAIVIYASSLLAREENTER